MKELLVLIMNDASLLMGGTIVAHMLPLASTMHL